MGTVNEWRAGGRGEGIVEMRKDFCSNYFQPLLENFDRRSSNDGIREFI